MIGIKIIAIIEGKNQVPSPSALPFTFCIVLKTINPKIITIINFKYLINRVAFV